MIHLLIAIIVAAILGFAASRSLGKFLNDVLNKRYPASIFKKNATKKYFWKERWKAVLSFQNIFTIGSMTALSVGIDSIIMSGIRYIPLNETATWFSKQDFSSMYWELLLCFFTMLYTTVSIICIDFYFYNLFNNTPDERLKRLIDHDQQ